jgi:hypothetical protein
MPKGVTIVPLQPPAKSASARTRNLSAPNGAPTSPPRWLVEWRIDLPLIIEKAAVEVALSAAEHSSASADPRAVAIELDRMCELYGTRANWDAIQDDYLEAFEDVPIDLVPLAFKRMRLSPRDFLPKPGQIRAQIIDDLRARIDTLRKLRIALTRQRDPEPELPPPTEAEIRQVDETVANAVRSIATRSAAAFYDEALPRGGGDPARRPRESEFTAEDRKRVHDWTAGRGLAEASDPCVLARLREMGVLPTLALAPPPCSGSGGGAGA